MFLRHLFNKGGLLGQHCQEDHGQPEMVQLNRCAHVTTLAARREGAEKDHERGHANHTAGNARSNFISTPAGMSVSLNIQGLSTAWEGQGSQRHKDCLPGRTPRGETAHSTDTEVSDASSGASLRRRGPSDC